MTATFSPSPSLSDYWKSVSQSKGYTASHSPFPSPGTDMFQIMNTCDYALSSHWDWTYKPKANPPEGFTYSPYTSRLSFPQGLGPDAENFTECFVSAIPRTCPGRPYRYEAACCWGHLEPPHRKPSGLIINRPNVPGNSFIVQGGGGTGDYNGTYVYAIQDIGQC